MLIKSSVSLFFSVKLRKMLVDENYLYAVVSLPAGVFKPYSGVKTSILFIDKVLASKTNNILFVKINSDGYDLGAQRRPIDKNDLPESLKIILDYKKDILNEKEYYLEEEKKATVNIVLKDKIRESRDFNLKGNRYLSIDDHKLQKWPRKIITELLTDVKYTNKIQKNQFLEAGKFPIIDQSNNFIAGYWNNKNDVFEIEKPVIVFGDHTRVIKYIDFNFVLGADGVKILDTTKNIIPKFLYYLLRNIELKNLGYSRHFKELKLLQIPLPPLEMQQDIINELNEYEKIIKGAMQVVEN